MALRALLVLGFVAAAFGACTRLEVVDPGSKDPIGEGGAAGEAQGGAGSVAGEAMAGDGGNGVTPGGAPGAAPLALWPTHPAPPEQQDSAAVLAAVTALSAGSQLLPIHERWDALSGATGSPRMVMWQRLDAMVAPFRERQRQVVFSIDVVDRARPAWPFTADLDSAQAIDAMRETIDQVFERYGGQLSLLSFGYELDRYVERASEVDKERLLTLLTAAVGYARSPQRNPAGTPVGVALSLGAVVAAPESWAELSLGDVAVAVYDPLNENGELKAPDSIEAELSATTAAIAELEAKPRPLVLLETGYPSAEAVGSSEQAQRAYVSSLVQALEQAAGSVSVAVYNGLSDRDAATCDAEASSFYPEAEADAPSAELEALAAQVSFRARTRCSMGLRAENQEPKRAWQTALSALFRE